MCIMTTTIDKQEISDAYEEVRDDSNTSVTWMLCKYDGNNIVLVGKGEVYEELTSQLGDDERAFAFARIIMGDELSKRAKFVLITWAGETVSTIKRAKMSTDKSLVKTVIRSFAVEIMASSQDEVTKDVVKEILQKAGGANYGTGTRD